MTGERHWDTVRPSFHKHFQFWPDHEDLIWAKSVWPHVLDAGLFSDQTEEAEAWTDRNILALSILYAQSAWQFGTPDHQTNDNLSLSWLSVIFGSLNNLDETLHTVGAAVRDAFPENLTGVGDPAFFLPLIRSLVTGSGVYSEGPQLTAYLAKVRATDLRPCEFREDALRHMWIGGHFSSDDLTCLH